MSFFRSSPSLDDQPARSDTIHPDFTTGHLHHLSQDQLAAFATFKDIIAKARLYTPATTAAAPTHDEPTLLFVPLVVIPYPVLLPVCVISQPLPPRPPLRPAEGREAVCRLRGVESEAQRGRPPRNFPPGRVRGRAQVLPPLDRPSRQGAFTSLSPRPSARLLLCR